MTIRHYYAELINEISPGIYRYKFTADSILMIDFGKMIVDINNKSCEIEVPMTNYSGLGWTIENQKVCITALTSKIIRETKPNDKPDSKIFFVS